MTTKREADIEARPTKELLNLKHQKVKLEQLYLDPNNPRFGIGRGTPDKRIVEDAVQQNTQKKIEEIGTNDLISSIQRYGFVRTDPVVVRRLSDDAFVIVEGNRRVAALKKLVTSHTNGEITFDDPEFLGSMIHLEVLLYEGKDPDIAWIVQGLRHMSGIKDWPPLQQATFIVKIEQEIVRKGGRGRGRPPGLPTVAKAAGVSTGIVARLVRSYHGFQQARNDDEYGDKIRDDKFSMFNEAVFRVDDLQKWLEWDDEARRFRNTENLRRFLAWITPPEDGGEPKIVRALDARDVLPDMLSRHALLRRFEKGSLSIHAARAEIERTAPPEIDLDSLKIQLSEFCNMLDTLPLPKIAREAKQEEFKELLESLRETIRIQIKNLGK